MSSCISSFSNVWHNEAIPGHHLAKPGIWIEKTAQWIVSDLPENRCDAVLEVIERIFFSLVVLIAFIPVALFSLCVALPAKFIAYHCLYSEPLKVEEKKETSENSPAPVVRPKEKTPKKPSPSAVKPKENEKVKPPLGVIEKKDAHIEKVEADGNCGFEAFLREMIRIGHPISIGGIPEFRITSAKWIAENTKKDPKLATLLKESIEEYLEVSLEWLKLEETQIPINISVRKNISQPEKEEMEKRLNEIPELKVKISEEIRKVQKAKSLEEITEIKEKYLKAIQSDTDTERVYASRAHYYAFCRMFETSVRIEIYLEREDDYNLIAVTKAPKEPSSTLRFLHSGQNHIDILILN